MCPGLSRCVQRCLDLSRAKEQAEKSVGLHLLAGKKRTRGWLILPGEHMDSYRVTHLLDECKHHDPGHCLYSGGPVRLPELMFDPQLPCDLILPSCLVSLKR